ncbi:MAG TPA: metalloregulator ArsR/SmtB family transcription factor [Candidatus Methanoperedens sp.]
MEKSKSKNIDRSSCDKYYLPQRSQREVRAALKRDVTSVSKMIKVLSDPIRLRIMLALSVQELCVCVLVEITDYRYSALSYHLKLLKKMGFVDSRREGTFLLYRLTDSGRMGLEMIKRLSEISVNR